MNKLMIIGNLVRDPESRTVPSGNTVCTFTVAVNRRRGQNTNQPEADFFRVSVWGAMGENCQKYLAKGRKVGVVGRVSANAFMGRDNTAQASLEVFAEEVEFLSSRTEDGGFSAAPAAPSAAAPAVKPAAQASSQYEEVEEDDLPF